MYELQSHSNQIDADIGGNGIVINFERDSLIVGISAVADFNVITGDAEVLQFKAVKVIFGTVKRIKDPYPLSRSSALVILLQLSVL